MNDTQIVDLATWSQQRNAPAVEVDAMARALAEANDVEQVYAIDRQLDLAEQYMRDSGLFSADQIRAINELRMRARWKLGKLLLVIDRGTGPGRGKNISQAAKSFLQFIAGIGLEKDTAVRAQRIGTLPEPELDKALAAAHRGGFSASYAYLLDHARPYWYAATRRQRHATIHANARTAVHDGELGPFPLLLVDPPWRFEVYSEKGLERGPDQHYPTLSDDDILNFKVGGRTVPMLAHRDAALFLWCTSSNVERALRVMRRWDFEFKTSATWVKDKIALGFVFRNKHELLLYGTRGSMPAPQYQPASVFEYPVGRHSAKPPEIRAEIERMYPDFDATTRLELFARDAAPGWTARGLEAAPGDGAEERHLVQFGREVKLIETPRAPKTTRQKPLGG